MKKLKKESMTTCIDNTEVTIPTPVRLEENNNYLRDLESNAPSCWTTLKNGEFAPAYPTSPSLPSGYYEIGWSDVTHSPTFVKHPTVSDELYELPSPEILDIVRDIADFWEREDLYKKYNFVHKRGILMYGEPGCGKSGIVQLICKRVINQINGIVINIKDERDLDGFFNIIPVFRKIEPNRPIVVILEDIDSIAGEGSYSVSRLLNILDGIKQIDGVVYLATTNYPERLQERLTNRPSRFDKRYHIDMPNSEIRKSYLLNKLTEDDLSKINLDEWVANTKGMSIAHLKELIVSVIVMGRGFEETIANLLGLAKKPQIKKSLEIGFIKNH
jgi:hypothetical protein